MTPRALGGGLAAPAREEVYVRGYADTREAVRVHAHELLVAAMERARGELRLAEARERGAKRLLDTHERHLRAQRGDAIAAEWLAAARKEATR